jgi:hypothetical protein
MQRFFVRSMTEIEARLNSVDRLQEYGERDHHQLSRSPTSTEYALRSSSYGSIF